MPDGTTSRSSSAAEAITGAPVSRQASTRRAIGRAGHGADHGEAENPRQDKAQAVVEGHGGGTISQIPDRCLHCCHGERRPPIISGW
jgi:hypothetical protein